MLTLTNLHILIKTSHNFESKPPASFALPLGGVWPDPESEWVSQLFILFSGPNIIGYPLPVPCLHLPICIFLWRPPYFWVQISLSLCLPSGVWPESESGVLVHPSSRSGLPLAPPPSHTYESCLPSQKIFPYVFIFFFSFPFSFPLTFFPFLTFSFPTRKRNSGRIATDARCPVSTFCRGGSLTVCGPARAVLATWPVRPARRRINRRARRQGWIGEGDVAAVQ